MSSANNKAERVMNCINCITGASEKLFFREDTLMGLVGSESPVRTDLFVGRGLIDLQINGINGIDFNNPAVSPDDIIKATRYLLSKGVTTFLPTVITNSDERVSQILRAIYQACESDRVVNDCIWGIHVEGPFISPAPGAKGAHDEKYIKPPDWKLVEKFQSAAGGKIKLITLAPEWEGACHFIRKCRENNIMVSIGHSIAKSKDIREAIEAGATLSTHLGNGVPLQLPRHPNVIWDQLASEELYACIITDGIHIPDSLIKVVTKTKGVKCLIVSDATCFAGMPPGEYENHIGGTVILDNEKRVSVKNSPGILAGAAKDLLENVETLLTHNLFKLSEAWQMASTNVAGMLVTNDTGFNDEGDLVIFKLDGSSIWIVNVIKKGRIVFKQESTG